MDKTAYLNFRGKKIFYRLAYPNDNQKHPGILFLHGAKSNKNTFAPLINTLKEKYVCLAFDRFGCGKSEGKYEEETLQSQFEQARFMLPYLLSC